MQTLSSSIVFLGVQPIPGFQLGMQTYAYKDLAQFEQLASRVDVLYCSMNDPQYAKAFPNLLKWKSQNPALQFVCDVDAKTSAELLLKTVNQLHAFKLVRNKDPEHLSKTLVQALEKARAVRQNSQIEELVQSQNIKLQHLYRELEERVEKRQKFLLEAKRKTFVANTRWEAVRQATIAIHEAISVREMERLLTEALSTSMHLESTRVFFKPHDQLFRDQSRSASSLSVFQAPIFRTDETDPVGSVFFIRDNDRPFLRDETDFLLKITEMVSLAIDRLSKLEQTEVLMEQWDATFNAISDPLSIIDKDYNILQTNAAFEKFAKSSRPDLIGKKCYNALFGRKSPCQQCILGSHFRLQPSGAVLFDVHSQSLSILPTDDLVHVNQYHDVADQQQMQQTLMNTARIAELGTIGSSIAHELNNPLGGILSFVQLLKMEKNLNPALRADLDEMEKGVQRCNEIVQNLLDYSRISNSQEETPVDLVDAVQQAVKILELRTKSQGVKISVVEPNFSAIAIGEFNLLSQAFQHLLEAFLPDNDQGHQRVLEISFFLEGDKVGVAMSDNSANLQQALGPGIPLAQQIFYDHEGLLEVSGSQSGKHRAKVTFRRPVFKS